MTIRPFREQKWLVLVVLGVPLAAGVMAVIGLNLMSLVERSRVTEVKIELVGVGKKIQSFHSDCARFPASDTGLVELLKMPADCPRWRGPYLTQMPIDPWGRPIAYHVEGVSFSLHSLGRDGVEGGKDADKDMTLSCRTSNQNGCELK